MKKQQNEISRPLYKYWANVTVGDYEKLCASHIELVETLKLVLSDFDCGSGKCGYYTDDRGAITPIINIVKKVIKQAESL